MPTRTLVVAVNDPVVVKIYGTGEAATCAHREVTESRVLGIDELEVVSVDKQTMTN